MHISTILNTKIRSTMLHLSGFELYSGWVPLICTMIILQIKIHEFLGF